MMVREDLYRRFAARFHAGKRLRPAAEAQVEAAEVALGVLWPESYRRFALTCGALSTGRLLRLVAEREPGYSDVQEFLTPRQSVAEARRSAAELGDAGLALAFDGLGNIFAFRDLPASPPRADDAPVWLIDLEEGTANVECPSFDAWIARFLEL